MVDAVFDAAADAGLEDAVDAIVFDVGGVFLLPHPEPIRSALAAEGIDVTGGDRDFHRAHYLGVRALAEVTVDEDDPSFWAAYERAYLAEVGTPPHELDRALVVWGRIRTSGVPDLWRWVEHHNVAALARFVAAGMPMAVVSNNDGTVAEQLRAFGVCQVGPGPAVEVAAVVDSGEIGVAKPDPAIFAPALAALGTDPARTLYVGDMVHADVAGARAAGMPVVQLDPYGFHAGFGHHRAPDLGTVAGVVLGRGDGS